MDKSEQSSESHPTKPSRRRDKPQLSCNLCRRKKLKCDRNQPCKNCEKRPLGSCVYVQSGLKTKTGIAIPEYNVNRDGVRDRIARLEHLVTSLAEGTQGRQGHNLKHGSSSGNDSFSGITNKGLDTFERLTIDGSEARYVTPSHWEAILEDITELKDSLAGYETTDTEPVHEVEKAQYPTILFGPRNPTTLMDIVCSMPPKSVFDEACTLFIKSVDVPTFCFHIPTLLKTYEAFWENPTSPSVSIPWLAQLHLLVVMVLQFATRTGATIRGLISPEHMSSMLTTRAAELLMLSDYTKPTKGTISAMMVYVVAEHFRTNSDFKISLVFSMLVRLALRAGYHRDPSQYPQISVFEGEIRRREWAIIIHFDLVLAFANGLPPIIDESKVSTRAPGSYLDEDLYPEMTSLPSPRPDDEQTWIAYLNFKLKSLRMLGKVVDFSNSRPGLPYKDVLVLDAEITSVFGSRPPWLKVPDAKSLHNLSAPAITRLCFVDLIASRARIILHRRFLVAARKNDAYSYSRRICLASATSTLAYQNELHSLSRNPAGLLTGNWRFLMIMAHDFVLAAIVLCVDIDQDLIRTGGNLETLPKEELEEVRERIELIETTYNIWTDAFTSYPDAKKASNVLRVVLAKVRRATTPASDVKRSVSTVSSENPHNMWEGIQTNETWNIPFPQPAQSQNSTFDSEMPDYTKLSGASNPVSTAEMLSGETGEPISAGSFVNTAGSMVQDFDWTEWDQCFNSSALDF